MNPTVIGIAGGSCSGKTSIISRLMCSIPSSSVIRHDDYYFSDRNMPLCLREKINYDHPSSYDNDMFVEHLRRLKNGEWTESPVYDYRIHLRSNRVRRIDPGRLLFVDGMLILHEERIRNLLDVCVFVDACEQIRLERRLARDMAERARTRQSVIDQFEQTVAPMHRLFVEPSRQYAQLIISGTEDIDRCSARILDNIGWKYIE